MTKGATVDGTLPVDLSILVPVYNERWTLERAIREMLDADYPVGSIEIVIVDDGSTDGTRELLQRSAWPDNVRSIFHDRNSGKGAAVQTALKSARGTYSTIMDADLEYDASEIASLFEPLLSGKAEVVFGTRGFQSHSAFNFWYVIGNKSVTLFANILFNSWISDMMTCRKIMSTELFRSLQLRERGFGIEPEITARLLKRGIRIYEVPLE